ncbi:hypothetical protein JCM11641_005624 [Rhodosporidiobolus odoratus]
MLRTAARIAPVSLRRPALVAAHAVRPSLPQYTVTTLARMASTTSGPSTSFDPQTLAAQEALDQGTECLQKGDFQGAMEAYKRSVKVKETSIGYYNLGVVQYQLQLLPHSIISFESSLRLSPPGVKPTLPDPTAPLPELTPAQIILADTHTNLGAAYILSKPPNPAKALEHLQKALMVNPDDGEVCYNLAAVLEATGELDEALVAFERALKLGIERAAVNIRNVSAKILGKKRQEEADAAANAAKAQAEGKEVPKGGSLEARDLTGSEQK